MTGPGRAHTHTHTRTYLDGRAANVNWTVAFATFGRFGHPISVHRRRWWRRRAYLLHVIPFVLYGPVTFLMELELHVSATNDFNKFCFRDVLWMHALAKEATMQRHLTRNRVFFIFEMWFNLRRRHAIYRLRVPMVSARRAQNTVTRCERTNESS